MQSRGKCRLNCTRWNWVMWKALAEQFERPGEMYRANPAAYEAGRRHGWIDKFYGPWELRHAKRYGHWDKVRRIVAERTKVNRCDLSSNATVQVNGNGRS